MSRENPRPTRSRLLAQIVLMLVASVIGLAIAEVGVRLLLGKPQIVQVATVDDVGRRAGEGEWVARVPNHPEEKAARLYVETPTGRRLRANARVTIENHSLSRRRIVIETNSLGYRNREIGVKTGRRFLFLGDSITFGDYVDEPQTFVRRIEARAIADGRAWETINAGVGAIGLDNEIAILLETGLATEPDVVVLDFYLNDFEASPGVSVVELPSPLDRSALLYYGAHFLAAGKAALRVRLGRPGEDRIDFRQWRDTIRRRWPPARDALEVQFRRRVLQSVHDWGGAFSPMAWDRIRPRLRELVALSEQQGFRLVVVMFPVRDQVVANRVFDAPQQQLARELAALGVPYLDLLPGLRSNARSGGDRLFYDHCHPTPRGNRIVAEAIYSFLVDRVAGDRELESFSR